MAYSATVAPLVIKGKVIIGISGAEYGIRGFIDAYDAKTGKRLWRFYTVPGADDKSEHARKALATWEGNSWLTGGGSAWVTGTYDPELNTLYWGIGNPSPDFNGEVRKGDNLYTCSILALNPDDGTYKWHFQNSPHDVWDYDGVNEPVLVDITRDGKPIKALVQAHRNGYFYCLNRENGEFLYGKPFCEVTWTDRTKGVDGLDPEDGPAVRQPGRAADGGGRPRLPRRGRRQGMEPDGLPPRDAASPIVPVINNCAKFTSGKAFFIKGQPYWGSSLTLIDNQASGSFKAIDVATGPDQVGGGHPLADGGRRAGDRRRAGLHRRRRGLLHRLRRQDGQGPLELPVRLGAPLRPDHLHASTAGSTSPSASAGAAGRPGSPATAPPGSATPGAAIPCSSSPCPRSERPSDPARREARHDDRRSAQSPGSFVACARLLCSPWAPGSPGASRTAAPAPKPLVVCAVPASMPRTGKAPDGTPQGLDVGRGRAGRPRPRAAGRVPLVRQRRVRAGIACPRAVATSWPASRSTPARRAAWPGASPTPAPSSAWSSRASAPGVRSLADLRGKRVGIVAGTVPLVGEGPRGRPVPDPRGAARRVRRPRRSTPRSSTPTSPPGTCTSTPSSACGSSTSSSPASAGTWPWPSAPRMRELLVAINRALAQLAESGELRKVYDELRRAVPPPVHGDRPSRAGAADTWRRVRDRGELVVSMDPANLPYSAARDDRPGLDVELARALADRLGV